MMKISIPRFLVLVFLILSTLCSLVSCDHGRASSLAEVHQEQVLRQAHHDDRLARFPEVHLLEDDDDHEDDHNEVPEDDHDDHDDNEDHDDHEDDSTSGLRGGKLWGYSILGGLVSMTMSLLGALVACVYPSYEGSETAKAYTSSFSVGVMMGLIFVHLIPEGAELAGGYTHNFKFPLCLLSGFFAGFFVLHVLAVLDQRKNCCCEPSQPTVPPTGETLTITAPISLPVSSSPGHHVFPLNGQQDVPQYPCYTPYPCVSSPVVVQGSNLGSPVDTPAEGATRGLAVKGPSLSQWSVIANISLGDFLCNFVDGMVTAAAFWECGISKGFLVACAVCFHELPQEISDFIILRRNGLSTAKALLANAVSSLATVLGIIVFLVPVERSSDSNMDNVGFVLAISSGFLLFVTIGLLPPIVCVKNSTHQVAICWALILLGCLLMFLSLLFHPSCGHDEHDH